MHSLGIVAGMAVLCCALRGREYRLEEIRDVVMVLLNNVIYSCTRFDVYTIYQSFRMTQPFSMRIEAARCEL